MPALKPRGGGAVGVCNRLRVIDPAYDLNLAWCPEIGERIEYARITGKASGSSATAYAQPTNAGGGGGPVSESPGFGPEAR